MMKTPGEVAVEIADALAPRGRAGTATPQCVEFVRAMVEAAVLDAFRAGFEHAVAGGEELCRGMFPPHSLPLVMYFGSEEDRREMIDAVAIAKPGMVEMKIPERRG